jgi:hypothetical protein
MARWLRSKRVLQRASAVCVLVAAGLSGCGGGSTVATAKNSSAQSSLDPSSLCDRDRQAEVGSKPVSVVSTLTAGFVVQIYRSSGADPGVWATVPADRTVVTCSYGELAAESGVTSTTACPDGRIVSSVVNGVQSFFLDAFGNSTPSVTPAPGVTIAPGARPTPGPCDSPP